MATRSSGEDGRDLALLSRENHDPDHSGINNSTDFSEVSDQGQHPRYLSRLAKGRAANFFINGDVFFPSKKIIYNPKHFKDFAHYLDYLTDKLEPRFGAVRKICTPQHGHRIRELRDLQENGVYVVAGKERFKPYQYDKIMSHEVKRSTPFNYNADPVSHNRQYLNSGRIQKCETRSLLIKVWPNGGDLKGPRRVLLTPRVRPFTLLNVLSQVNEILKEDCVGTVEKLYFLNGVQISDVDQIIQNGQYVACKRMEKFKRARYNEQATKNLSTSPRLERKLLPPLYPYSNNSTNQSTPEYSNPSIQNSVTSSSQRRRTPQGDRIFPSRPVQHTRGSEWIDEVDLDRDQERLFKAKQSNRNAYRARPVRDNKEMKTDMPIDQRKTKEIEEYTGKENRKENHPRQGNLYRKIGVKADITQAQAFDTRKKDIISQQQEQSIDTIPQVSRGHKAHNKILNDIKAPVSEVSRQLSTDRLKEEDNAAAKIQGAYRGHKTRKELHGDKLPEGPVPAQNTQYFYDDRLEELDDAATKIQAVYRGHQTRNELRQSKLSTPTAPIQKKQTFSYNMSKEKESSAAKIQAAYRGYQTRRQLGSSSNQRGENSNDKREDSLQKKVQATGRDCEHMRSTPPKNFIDEDEAATKIQAAYRGYETRQQLVSHTSVRNEDKAATTIQAGFRGYQTRKRLDAENRAAAKIQGGIRGYLTRKNMTSACEDANVWSEEDKAAAKIQAGYRGYLSRNETSGSQPPPREDSYHGLDRENEAAVTIQSHYRGYLARREVANRQEYEFNDKYWP